jgi:hypothetical protein
MSKIPTSTNLISSNLISSNLTSTNTSLVFSDNDILTGYDTATSITLKDEKDGSEWCIKIYDGELIIEPVDKVAKRNYNIKRVLK